MSSGPRKARSKGPLIAGVLALVFLGLFTIPLLAFLLFGIVPRVGP